MRTYDFAPLWRSSVGFDRLFDLINDTQRLDAQDNYRSHGRKCISHFTRPRRFLARRDHHHGAAEQVDRGRQQGRAQGGTKA